MKLLQLYESILNAACLSVDADGFVSVRLQNDNSPTTVNGKRLALPTQKHLANPQPDSKMIFHPLSENIMRGESEVTTKLRHSFNVRFNFTFAAVAQSLLQIASSVAEHHKLNPEQSEVLSALKDADETTLVNFSKIMVNSIKNDPGKSFVNIYLKRGGKIGDKKYARIGVVSFPFYEQLQNKEEDVCGVKLRVKDRATLKALCEYIFPAIKNTEAYNAGSDSQIAPFLEALMKTVKCLAMCFNDIFDLFNKHIEGYEELVFNSDWVETLDNLPSLMNEIRMIPIQAGNEGSTKANGVVGSNLPTQQPLVTPVTQPIQNTAYTPPVPMQTNYHNQQYNQPVVQNPTMPQGLVKTDKGIDLQSLLKSNPAMFGNHNFQQQMQQVQAPYVPRFANPQFNQPQNNFNQNPGYPMPGNNFNRFGSV